MLIRGKAFFARENGWLLIPTASLLALGFGGILTWTQIFVFGVVAFLLGYLFPASLKNS